MSPVSHSKYLRKIMREKFAFLDTVHDRQRRIEVVIDLFDTVIKNIEFIREDFGENFVQIVSSRLLLFRSDDQILLDKKYDVLLQNS